MRSDAARTWNWDRIKPEDHPKNLRTLERDIEDAEREFKAYENHKALAISLNLLSFGIATFTITFTFLVDIDGWGYGSVWLNVFTVSLFLLSVFHTAFVCYERHDGQSLEQLVVNRRRSYDDYVMMIHTNDG